MKHFRILEIKDKNKYYVIQYLNNFIFGLHSWKKLSNKKYSKYDDALSVIKTIIKQSDYETSSFSYHYIDAYKIFKKRSKENN